jgi:tRNA threonylcarbamoyladenosine biosynthesis protein TsaE
MNPSRRRQDWTKRTGSPEETRRLAEVLGRLLEPGDVIALAGELGSGKTLFAQGLARGLQVPESFYITSPSFAIVNEYPGKFPFYHLDLYRVSGTAQVFDLGLEEIFYGEGVTAVEWPEGLGADLPQERLEVHLAFAGENERFLTFRGLGERAQRHLGTVVAIVEDA